MFSSRILCLVAVVAVFAVQNAYTINPSDLTLVNDAKETLTNSLSKLSSADGPHYKLSKLISVSRFENMGYYYRIRAELVNLNNETKECYIEIWSHPVLENNVEVILDCEGEERLLKYHSL